MNVSEKSYAESWMPGAEPVAALVAEPSGEQFQQLETLSAAAWGPIWESLSVEKRGARLCVDRMKIKTLGVGMYVCVYR